MDKKLLIDLYIEKGMSQRRIAEKLRVSQSTVRHYLLKHDVKRADKCVPATSKLCPSCKEVKLITEFYDAIRKERRSIGSWCKVCMSTQVIARQQKYKAMYVEQKGGFCQVCNFNKYLGALEFHHLDPKEKDSKISSMSRHPDSPEMQKELAKCVLLCSNCHKMVHAGIISL